MSAASTSSPITNQIPIASSHSNSSTISLLRTFLSLQSSRGVAYGRFHTGFRTFLADREEFERQESLELEKRSKESTVLQTQAQHARAAVAAAGGDVSSELSESIATRTDESTLKAIEADNTTAEQKKSRVNPEQIFQLLCIELMKEFQSISADVRAVIAELVGRTKTATVATTVVASSSAAHFAARLAALQQLEKLKLELTIHQQMLHNQYYVLRHPRAHGQLQEHSHHVHSVTDKYGKIREHPSHAGHAHGKTKDPLSAIGEDDSCVGEDDDHSTDSSHDQELSDNAQPFTRHLSALLSDTAFQSDSPFLFPPSGAAPTKHLPPIPTETTNRSTLHPHISDEVEEKHHREVSDLKDQEYEVVEKINEILEEVRMEVMEDETDTNETDASEEDQQ